MQSLSVVLALATLSLLLQGSVAVQPNELTFAQLRDTWNTTGQFRIQLATGNKANPGVWKPVNCSNPLLGACLGDGDRPLEQGQGDLIRFTYTFTPKTPMKTYMNMAPTTVEFRFCYTTNTSVNRGWRTKNKPYPRLSQNCNMWVATLPFNGTIDAPDAAANSGVVVYDMERADGFGKATMFAAIWVRCGDQVCAFQTTEGRPDLNPPVNGNFIEITPFMGITTGMIVSASILSAIGPLFLLTYFFADRKHYNTKGKPLVF